MYQSFEKLFYFRNKINYVWYKSDLMRMMRLSYMNIYKLCFIVNLQKAQEQPAIIMKQFRGIFYKCIYLFAGSNLCGTFVAKQQFVVIFTDL
jgi:hypothetical protein